MIFSLSQGSPFTRVLLISVALALGVPAPVYAKIFPLRENANTDVIYLDNSQVDFAIRNLLVSRANHTIQVVSLIQAADQVGLPFENALRDAMNRGVSVEYAYESLATMKEGDPLNDSKKLLIDSNLRCPGEVICPGPIQKIMNGLSVDDFIHQKILLIDAGTPDEVAIIGGRGYSEFSTNTIDSAFILRPVDSSKPSMVTDIHELTQDFFDRMRKMYRVSVPKPAPKRALRKLASHPEIELNEESQLKEYHQLESLLDHRPMPGETLAPNQFRPRSTQLVTNDLFAKVMNGDLPRSMNKRLTTMQNDIADVVGHLMETYSTMELTTYIQSLPKTLHKKLLDFVSRGGKFKLYTNGREAHKELMLGGAPVDYTIDELKPILEKDQAAHGQAEIYFLDGEKIKADPNAAKMGIFPYVHRKMIIFKNQDGAREGKVVSGSDNITRSAYAKNDELIGVFEDSRMVRYMEEKTQAELPYYTKMDQASLNAEAARRPWYFCFLRQFIERMY